jgi:hypothetical protein
LRGEAVDPSHARKYLKPQIEGIAAELLNRAHPEGIEIPIDIDLLVQQHPRIDDLIPANLEDRFKVAAALVYKPGTCAFDIFFDENTVPGRVSFSIAHEFGHVVLHSEVCDTCHTLEAAIELRARLKKHYVRMEADAEYFARCILMPRGKLERDTGVIYSHLARSFGCDGQIIQSKLCPSLATRYKVSNKAMEIRLQELMLHKRITLAIQHGFDGLDI